MVPSKGTVFNSSPANSIARAFTIVFIYLSNLWSCFTGAARRIVQRSVGRSPKERTSPSFGSVRRSVSSPSAISNLSTVATCCCSVAPACMWLGLWASEWYQTGSVAKIAKAGGHRGVAPSANVLIFLASPFYCSYRQVRRFEAELESIKTALPQVASARDTLILSFDSHFNGFRHAGYYLPDYLTVEYPEAQLKEGPRIFSMHERDTQLVTQLPSGPYTRFVLFPLPAGDSYKEYIQKVIARLPSESLQTVSLGGHEFVTGSISDLPLLFPEAHPNHRSRCICSASPRMPPVNSRSH